MITIASLWIVAVVVLLFFLARSVRTVRRALRCPILGTDVQVKFLEVLPEGRPLEVTACNALKPPTNIVCSQRCLELLAHPTKRLTGN
jgi:hypothetical protein